MLIEPALLLGRMADTLRHDVGPAVGDEFARTQAFMASVILAKLASELAAMDAEAVTAAAEHGRVARELRVALGEPPAGMAEALDGLERDGATARWNATVTALYGCRERVGPETFERALHVLRASLRARLDRVLGHAR